MAMSIISARGWRHCLCSSGRLVARGVSVQLNSSSQDFDGSCKILGVAPTASQEEVKAAFHELSIRWHPDKGDGSQEAHDKFKAILEAYDIVTKRKKAEKMQEEEETGSFVHKTYRPLSVRFDNYIQEVKRENRQRNRKFYSDERFTAKEEVKYHPLSNENDNNGSTLTWFVGLVLSVVLAGAGLVAHDRMLI